jgi:hypothetical protein
VAEIIVAAVSFLADSISRSSNAGFAPSGIHQQAYFERDCPPPDPLTSDPVALRLSEFFDQLTILGRQILSSDQLTSSKIDMYTDRLIALWDIMPDSLQFDKSWIKEETEIPEWPMETRATSEMIYPHLHLLVTDIACHSIILQYTQLCHTPESSAHREQ